MNDASLPEDETACARADILWRTRMAAVRLPEVRFGDVARLDSLLAEQLDLLSQNDNWAFRLSARSSQETPEANALFIQIAVALMTGNAERLDEALTIALATVSGVRTMAATIAWLPLRNDRTDMLRGWLASEKPTLRYIALHGLAEHRHDPGVLLDKSLTDPQPSIRIRACQAAGELGRGDLHGALLGILSRASSNDPIAVQFEAAHSAVLLGDREDGVRCLMALACGDEEPIATRAAMVVARLMEAERVAGWLDELPSRRRIAVVAALGASGYVAELLDSMADEETAPFAARAFRLITGCVIDRESEGWPAQDSDFWAAILDPASNPAMEPDDPPPAAIPVDLFREWWSDNRLFFALGARYREGLRDSAENRALMVSDCRGAMRQATGEAVALDMVLETPGAVLQNVHSRANPET